MPSYDSTVGIWKPAKEKVVVQNEDGQPQIYEGPDRAALEFLKQEGQEFIGIDARKDPENIMRARQLNMSVEDFLGMNTPPTAETLRNEEAKKTNVVTHASPNRKRATQITRGGFYDPEKNESPKP